MKFDYDKHIESESLKIAKLIDEGKNLKKINQKVSREHSLFSMSCAISEGIRMANNRKNAEKVRIEWNKSAGIKDPNQKGIANMAMFGIGAKTKERK